MMSKIIYFHLFIVFVSAYNDYCDIYCYEGSHTVCGRGPEKCGLDQGCGHDAEIIHFTDEERQLLVNIHNQFRNKLASGMVASQPAAADMKAVSYNKELEFIARCWANKCQVDHDACRDTNKYPHVGQNIGVLFQSLPIASYVGVAIQILSEMFNEYKNFNPSWIKSYHPPTKWLSEVARYTQLVWAETREIGCALTHFKVPRSSNMYRCILVCNYGPAGNRLDYDMYTVGTPASRCGFSKPNKRYRALCGKDRPLNQTDIYINSYFGIYL